MNCKTCGILLDEQEAIWALPNGWLSVTFGDPYCGADLPIEEELRIETFGAFLAQTRKSAKLSQTAFANRAGLSTPTIAKIESGDMNYTLSTLFQVLHRGLDLDDVKLFLGRGIY